MVYRKTENVLAQIEAKRTAIIEAAIKCLRKDGFAGMTCTAIAERAKISMGKVFYHFPDMTEVAAQVEAVIMARDIEAIDSVAERQGDHPQRQLVAALLMTIIRLSDRPSRELYSRGESYRISLARKLAHFIGPNMQDRSEARMLAPAVLAALFAMALSEPMTAKRIQAIVVFVLRGIGVSEAAALRALDAVDKMGA